MDHAQIVELECATLDVIAANLRKYPDNPRVALAQAGNIEETARQLRERVVKDDQ